MVLVNSRQYHIWYRFQLSIGNRGPNHPLKTTKALYIREENSPDRKGQRQPIETLEQNRDPRSWPLRPGCKQTKQQRRTDSQLIIGGTNIILLSKTLCQSRMACQWVGAGVSHRLNEADETSRPRGTGASAKWAIYWAAYRTTQTAEFVCRHASGSGFAIKLRGTDMSVDNGLMLAMCCIQRLSPELSDVVPVGRSLPSNPERLAHQQDNTNGLTPT